MDDGGADVCGCHEWCHAVVTVSWQCCRVPALSPGPSPVCGHSPRSVLITSHSRSLSPILNEYASLFRMFLLLILINAFPKNLHCKAQTDVLVSNIGMTCYWAVVGGQIRRVSHSPCRHPCCIITCLNISDQWLCLMRTQIHWRLSPPVNEWWFSDTTWRNKLKTKIKIELVKGEFHKK